MKQKLLKTGLILSVLLMLVPADMAARRKKIVYLKTGSGEVAYYQGEVNDADAPEGEGSVVVERTKTGYAGRGEVVLHLDGTFSRDGVSNAVLVVNTQPAMLFRGQLSYVVQAGRIDVDRLTADVQAYEFREANHKEKVEKLQRAAEYLSETEREQKLTQLEKEQQDLKTELQRLTAVSSAVSRPEDKIYAVLHFTLKQGTLELEKWNWKDASSLTRAAYAVSADSPVNFDLVANNGDLLFGNDLVSRNRSLEQKFTGDVVGGTYIDEVRMFEVTPAVTLRPSSVPLMNADTNKDQLMADDPYYERPFEKAILGNYFKGRRKVDGRDQTVTISKTGIKFNTPSLKEETTQPLGVINTAVPFIELRNDGIYIAESIGEKGIESRRPLDPKPEPEPEPEVVETAVAQPEPVAEAVPNAQSQEDELRQRLSLNVMTDKSVMGPWQVASGNASSTWNFRSDATMTFSPTDTERRTWTMDNHLITIKHTNTPNPSILEVIRFMPDTMQLKDTAGTVFVLRRDTTLMTPDELATYHAATASFVNRMKVMTGEIPEAAPAAIPATVEVAIPATVETAVPAVAPVTQTVEPTTATPADLTQPTDAQPAVATESSNADDMSKLKEKLKKVHLPHLRKRSK